ncbi:MAG TPA: SLC13 family permease [Vicinamibacterales bacterium]|nr:SLC13 family permease [Vicinamibacterales bacterium]
MTWEAWAALALVGGVLYALARNLADPDVVLLGGVAVVITLGQLSDRFPGATEAAAILGNEGLLTVGMLFVVAAGLTETGALRLITDRVLGRPTTIHVAQVRLMLPVIGISAFLNNTPVVAMFVPVVREWCRRTGLSPSQLFIPLSYASILGGVCTLIGTSTNLVVQGLLLEAQKTDPTVQTFGMFTTAPIGVPIAIAGTAFILLFSSKLLPDRRPNAATFASPRQYSVEMFVEPGSPIDGATIEEAGLRQLPGLFLAAIERSGLRRVAVPSDERLRGNDLLTFAGVVDSVVDLQRVRGLTPATDQILKLQPPRHARFLAEAVVSAECPLVGKTIRDGRFRTRYEAVILAVRRNGESVDQRIGDIELHAGDTLLLETTRRFLRQHRNSRDFFLVSGIPDSQGLRHDRAWIALAILAGMVVVVSAETVTHVSVFHGALLAAIAMGLTRCLSADQARRSVDWSTLVAIGSALVLGKAMETSGLAGAAAGVLVEALQPMGPVAVLAGIYLLTLVFTELVTNNAAAALSFPIALATAHTLDVNFLPFAVIIAVAASSGFATPLGYQTHLMVYGAGGYRFSDYVRVGVPLDLIVMIVAILLTPLVFPLR